MVKYSKGKGWNTTKVVRILKDHKAKYEGGLIRENKNNICWPQIIKPGEYRNYPRNKNN